jgi:hypothetical protein
MVSAAPFETVELDAVLIETESRVGPTTVAWPGTKRLVAMYASQNYATAGQFLAQLKPQGINQPRRPELKTDSIMIGDEVGLKSILGNIFLSASYVLQPTLHKLRRVDHGGKLFTLSTGLSIMS